MISLLIAQIVLLTRHIEKTLLLVDLGPLKVGHVQEVGYSDAVASCSSGGEPTTSCAASSASAGDHIESGRTIVKFSAHQGRCDGPQ